jgi:hypothetical protein
MSAACERVRLWPVIVVVVSCVCGVFAPARAVASERKPFGIKSFTLQTTVPKEMPEDNITPGGFTVVNEPYTFTQAGGHPLALTTTFVFDSEEFVVGGGEKYTFPTQDPKDIVVDLPSGLIGDPMAVPRCSLTNVTNKKLPCPADTQVGLVRFRFFDGEKESLGPIYNVTPEAGQSAEFALVVSSVNVLATAHLVRTPQGYGITVASNKISMVELLEAEVTFWGVPAEARYDWMRGLVCLKPTHKVEMCKHGVGEHEPPRERAGLEPVPFLTMGTDCAAGPQSATMRADSWEEPGSIGVNGQYNGYVPATATMPAVTGCNLLKFEPGIAVHPDTLLADAPVGLGVGVSVPQSEQPGTLGTPHLREATITLPLGMSISPGIVDGIQACDKTGPGGINFTGAESEEAGLNGELQLAPGHCPDASIVGEAEAETPLLEKPVEGHVYLARPGCGGSGEAPCTEQDALDGNLYKLYLELGGTGALGNAGVNIKVEGRVQANPATGQLTAVFDENPQTPFSKLEVHLNGGPRAPIDNPAACGLARTTADFMPWSAPGRILEGPSAGVFVAGTPDATPFSEFEVQGCSSPPGLSPGFLAGTVTPQAGQFSQFTLNLSRKDREQYVKGIRVHTPPGLLGMLSSVPLCAEPEAELGKCPTASRIGSTTVASGAGSHPFEIGGNVYLTGPYHGAPFGLSIVTNAVAGPFNLGLVIVRARIDVNPQDSTLTITTDESGPRAVPQIIFGVPLRLQRVTVNIDRPNFMFNPTNCKAQQITASVSGNQNATATVQSPFAVGGCKSLEFKPKFAVSTNGHTSRANGASLDAKLSYPAGSMGKAANIARVKVSLPKQLPSRLTTLQKACPAATFDANPAGCPSASIVGIARATTPLLPVGLSGPVYFVSHGGEAFPSLIVVLQGDGVRVDLTGSTFISKAGITSSTFKTVPDVPVSTFELYLPEGKYSALAANGNLCKSKTKLVMPSEFVAQNGAVVKQSTKIAVTGCSKAKKAKTKPEKKAKAKKANRAGNGRTHR